MPVYPGTGRAQVVRPGDQVFFFKDEPAVSGKASIAFALDNLSPRGVAGFSIQFLFSASPGAAGTTILQAQGAEMDQDDAYVLMSTITAPVAPSLAARSDLMNSRPKFVRLMLATIPNSGVNVTAVLTR